MGKRSIKRADIVIARDGKKSLVMQLNFRVAEAGKEDECVLIL